MPKVLRLADLPPSPLEGMCRGTKQMWLRQHRELILQCRDIFGDDWVCHFFCMLPKTLDTLMRQPDNRNQEKGNMVNKNEVEKLRIEFERLRVDLAEVKRTQRELEQLFNQFVESTGNQITKTLIIPLLRNVLQFEGNLPDVTDPLVLDHLLAQAKNR